jgi:hypothetical protein
MRFMATRMAVAAGLLAAACGGCGLILGIKDVSGDGLGGGGAGGATASTSTSSTSTTTSSTTSTTSSTTASTSSGGCTLKDCGNGVCTDTSKDPDNCGACGRSCNGGLCQNGMCGVAELVMGESDLKGIAVDKDAIFYLRKDGVVRLEKPQGSSQKLLAQNYGTTALTVGLDATSVYWIESAGTMSIIHSVDKLNGGTPTILAKGQAIPLGIAVSSTDVYWTNAAAVVTAAKTAMSSAGTTFASSQGPVGIAIDANNVYWTDITAASVFKKPLVGGSTQTVAMTQGSPWGIAVSKDVVVWAAKTAAAVRMAPIAGGGVIDLATGVSMPEHVAVVGDVAYFTSSDAIWRADLIGQSSTAIVTSQSPTGVAADSSGVYWTTADGHVRFLAQ